MEAFPKDDACLGLRCVCVGVISVCAGMRARDEQRERELVSVCRGDLRFALV